MILLVLTLVHYGASEPKQTNASATSGNSQKSGNNSVTVTSYNASVSQQTNTGGVSGNSKKSGSNNIIVASQETSVPRQADAQVASGSSKKSANKNTMTSPQGFAFDQVMQFFNRKTGKGLTAGKKGKDQNGNLGGSPGAGVTGTAVELPAKPVVFNNTPGFTKIPKLAVSTPAFSLLPKPSVVSVSRVVTVPKLVVPPPVTRVAAIVKINQELQNIISMNQNIRRLKEKQSAQLENVQGEKLVHQAILDEQQKGLQKEELGQKTPEEKALLAQEKLRKIHEETQRNTQMTNELEEIPSETGQGAKEKS